MKAEIGVLVLLAPIKGLLSDAQVSEIMINRPKEVYYEKQGSMHNITVPEYTNKTLGTLFQLIANESQQVLNNTCPLLSASLQDGSRVQLVLPPVALFPCLSIRRKQVHKISWEDYESSGMFSRTQGYLDFSQSQDKDHEKLQVLFKRNDWHQFLSQAVKMKKNIVVSGGTSTGKTTFMNALLGEITQEERLIILEDTREIQVPHKNIVQLLSSKGEQGLAKVSMQDLVQCCLRLRPDRIICGEIRGREILDFIAACSTGHDGSMTSIHASSPKLALMRMTQMYKLNNLPFMTDEAIMMELNQVVDIIVQLAKGDSGRYVQSVYFKT